MTNAAASLTALEQKVLVHGVFHNDFYRESGWAWTDTVADYAGVSGSEFRGVRTSLITKGMLQPDGNIGRDACVRPTKLASEVTGLPLCAKV